MNKILITGVAGLLGSNLAKHLLQNENNYIYGLDNFSSSTMSNLYELLKHERFEFIEHDLLSKIPFQTNIIFHLAGWSNNKYPDNGYDYILNKIKVSENILNHTKDSGSKLLFVTKHCDYNEINSNLSRYFDSIKLVENLALDLIENNKINCNIVRLDNIYGENNNTNDKNFVYSTIKKALNNAKIEIDFDEKIYLSYVHDVVAELVKLSNIFYLNPIIDISSNELYLKSQIIEIILEFTNSKSIFEKKSNIIYTPNYKHENIDIDFICNTDIKNGLRNTIDHFKLMYF